LFFYPLGFSYSFSVLVILQRARALGPYALGKKAGSLSETKINLCLAVLAASAPRCLSQGGRAGTQARGRARHMLTLGGAISDRPLMVLLEQRWNFCPLTVACAFGLCPVYKDLTT